MYSSILAISCDPNYITRMLVITNKMYIYWHLWQILVYGMTKPAYMWGGRSDNIKSYFKLLCHRSTSTFVLLSCFWGPMGEAEGREIPTSFSKLFGTLYWTSVGSLSLGRGVFANPELKTTLPSLWICCHLRRYHADTLSIKKMLKNSSYTYDQTN